jgi:hypothetical protein
VNIACPNCGRSLPPEVINAPELRFCPSCNSNLLVRAFPSHSRPKPILDVAVAEVAEDDARCFFHSSKPAVTSCSQCGRFLCALCEVNLSGAILCPGCLESSGAKKKIRNLENHRTLWDTTCLLLGVAPLIPPFLMIYLMFITGPMAVFLPLRHWRTPSSLIPRAKWRFIAGALLGLLQIAALVAFIMVIIAGLKRSPVRGAR